ncbi:ABC transporter ATP-binding protein [Candidatus Xianfuyuplasma coldseepsis]|uniref:ABC transporter ATP-binding protein n=1 Tax=Candidatus Xianfuyuplasma coldseepsis TaxID=2782163 RepID=A0A7L7KRT2_9MOLU|nr:ABC transporter ATP-binding protein [Xianfuyuplasma coldseepsis]QMS85417.1 ABC transporter ATP-binding protein [Xianfuyuplasma coldseepsis]
MFKTFAGYYRNHMFLFVGDTIAALAMSGINLFFPDVLGRFVDDFIVNKDISTMYLYGIILAILYIIRMGCNYFVNYYGHVMGTRIERDMRIDLFEKIQTLDSDYFDDHKTGSIMTHIVGHLRDISEMAHHTPENVIVSTIMLIGSFIILFKIHVFFTIVIFVLLLLLILFSAYRRDKMMNASRKTRATHEEINSEVENSIGGIRLTKAFTNEDFEIKKFQRVTHLYQESFGEFYKQMGIFSSGTNVIIDLLYVVVLVYGGILVSQGEITLGDYTRFFFYLTFLIQPIRTLISTIEQVQKGWSGYEKFYHILNIQPKITSPKNPLYLDQPEGTIEFRNVTFQYESSRSDVLHNFNVTIQPGKKVALVGETGVGKSTISKLIPRFYDVNEGEIFVDGHNVKDYDIYSLRSHIGHVQQDVYIFYGSIQDNILYGNPTATYDDVIEAAKKANIHDFIMTLDDGYKTLVGERGVKLSGGQKQRVSIARVFLKNPPILILDEATSSLDNITEKMIQRALDNLSVGRTTLVIAHRLSTISNADEILVLTEDGVKERGTHKELIANNGYYAQLYRASIEI